jgi:hypothetical protein
MSMLILILAVIALTAVGWTGAYLYDLVRNDGYGHRPARQAPRSHRADPFDPDRFPAFPLPTQGPTRNDPRRHAA